MAQTLKMLRIPQLVLYSRGKLTSNPFNYSQGVRHLYARATLGLTGYEESRQITRQQIGNIADKFKTRMTEYTSSNSKNMIFTEDLKNMLHLAESDEDLELVVKMIKKFNNQNKELRFGNFVFGSIAMRLLHLKNKPELALQLFTDPDMKGFFDQLITYQLILDLLYENGKYQEMLNTFEVIKERQIEGTKYPRNIIVLVMAACYKLNSPESLKYALNIWNDLNETGHLPMRRAVTFCAGLALNQNDPAAAIEILSLAKNKSYTTVRNIKAVALVRVGRLEEAVLLLKSVLQSDTPDNTIQTFNKNVIEEVKQAVDKCNSADMKKELERVALLLEKQGHVCDKTLEEQLCSEIQTPPHVANKRRQNLQNSYTSNSQNYRRANKPFSSQRPGLKELV